jgi:protoporphyrinogen/coproporphyrinogen III oxidase
MKRFVVIGGGITGLAAAYRLLERQSESKNSASVTLLEASARVGGTIQTEKRDGFLLECGPDSFISEKPEALKLATRLGLEARIIETNPDHRRSFVVRNGKLAAVPEGFHLLAPGRLAPFFNSEIFSWRGKARIAMEMLLPRKSANGEDDESLAHFVRRRLGSEALARMAQPMVGGIYTADPEKLSLKATMPRFLQMEREHGSLIRALQRRPAHEEIAGTSGARYSLFLSFDSGMQLLTDTLADRVSTFDSNGVTGEVRLNTRVASLELKHENGKRRWLSQTDSGEAFTADAVCLALPVHVSSRLLRSLDAKLADELKAIPTASSITINLGWDRKAISHSLDGFGFVVPFIEKKTILACSFSSVKFAGRAPGDQALLRVFAGGALQPELFDLPDAELLLRVKSDLRDLLQVSGEPMIAEISRWRDAMPQYHVGHLDRVQRIRERTASLPGFALAGNAYAGLGIPDCVRSGEEAADSLINDSEA